MKKVLLGLVCLLSLVSCKKGPVTVVYSLEISAEATHPDEIADSGMRDTYKTLLRDLQRDLDPNFYSLDPRKIGAVINRAVLSMDPKDIPAEDEHRIAEFNDYLPKLKEIEASYKKSKPLTGNGLKVSRNGTGYLSVSMAHFSCSKRGKIPKRMVI